MNYEELKQKYYDEFIAKLCTQRSVSFTRSGTFQVNSESINHKNFTEFFLALTRDPQFSEYFDFLKESGSVHILLEDIKKGCRFYLSSMKNVHFKEVSVLASFDYTNYVPIISMEDSKKIAFFDMKTKEICELDYKTYEMVVAKEERKAPLVGKIEFNPFRPERIYVSKYRQQQISHVNLYKCPEWQYTREISYDEVTNIAKLPKIINEFMSHLFPDKDCREFVYDWLHFALTKRCETYLVLNGAKGIGKGIFTDHLCRALLGKENHKLAPPGALESNFNALLENCRMIVFDEFKIDEDDKINKLKRYINKDQMIEKKGQDVSSTIETYNSFVISSNSTTDMRIEWDDRRFSVADISTVKLDTVWSKEKINELISTINDEAMTAMRSFGYWLLYRKPANNEFHAYKGSHFYKLCYSSLPEWCRTIIDEISSGKYETIDDISLKMTFKERSPQGRFPNVAKVEDFINNYMHDGIKSLGKLVREENGAFVIEVSDDFFRGRDNTGIEWTKPSNEDDDLL